MKRRLRLVGFVFGFIATVALTAHATHDHSNANGKVSHQCVLCHTPSLDTATPSTNFIPLVTVADVSFIPKQIFLEVFFSASSSPRAPPAA